MRRAVGAIRVSRMRDASTSPEVQEDKIKGWCQLHDAELAGIAVDKDVSGKGVSPWEREDLGKWMSRPQDFDVLVATKLDRVCRDAMEFFRLIVWAKENKIAVVFIMDGIDLSTPGGEMAAKILAVVAEWDWNRIRENTLDGQQKAISQGRFKGAIAPFGYRQVKETRDGITGTWLVPDENLVGIVREMVARVTAGRESVASIARDLNQRGIPVPADAHRIRMGRPSKGAQWRSSNIVRALRSRNLLGEYTTNDNSTLRDETGLPIAKAEPLVSRQEYSDLQKALDKISRKKEANRPSSSEYQGVIVCGGCGKPYYHLLSHGKGTYRCSSVDRGASCGNRSVRADVIREQLDSSFRTAFDGMPMLRRVVSPAEDHSEDIAALTEELDNLTGNLARVKPGSTAAEATLRLIESREESLQALRSLPERRERVEWLETGEDLTSVWDGLSDAERGLFLRDHEVKLYFRHPRGSDDVSMLVMWGRLDEMREALASRSA
ncbi:recombinase family protein [Actinoallomurus sp. NBC_01490]|uniref:recombinase family protein n=1 Tax=Actinoallomurus sp. NBC_01490 TaxID=2903557 RepID=UPI002E32733A|nr:recombinase family protein [Actinoallomurus sp. NBC_01490]